MWTRAELKSRGKYAFQQNYWKAVLISVLLTILMGGGALTVTYRTSNNVTETYYYGEDEEDWYYEENDSHYNNKIYVDYLEYTASVAVVIVFLVLIFIGLALILLIDAFILGPLEVGCQRFFIRNLTCQAEVKEVAYGFDHNYKNIVKASFLKDIYTVLWTLLFIIPGIVKSYEYRMIPYLLAENPQITSEQAFAVSKQMMNGQKWNTFVLDLSFLGWGILNLMTAGILGIFYVAPYRNMTNAALYDKLKQIGGAHPLYGQNSFVDGQIVYGYTQAPNQE